MIIIEGTESTDLKNVDDRFFLKYLGMSNTCILLVFTDSDLTNDMIKIEMFNQIIPVKGPDHLQKNLFKKNSNLMQCPKK